MSNIINMGIPVYSSLVLPIYDMTLLCSDNKVKSIDVERDIRYEAQYRVSKITGTFSCCRSTNFLQHINFYANRDANSVLDVDSKQRIINMFEYLVDLNRKDSIDSLLSSINDSVKELSDIVHFVNNNPYSTSMHDDLKDRIPSIYYGKSNKADLRYYLNSELKHYSSIYNDIDKVLDIDYSDMFGNYLDSLNIDKVKFYLAYYYLESLIRATVLNDFNLAQECCFYLSSYFTGRENNLSILINNKIVTYKSLKDEFIFILNKYPNLKRLVYDRNFFLNHSKEDNLNVIDSLLKMKTVRTDEFFVKGGKDSTKKGSNKGEPTELTDEEERLVKEYMDHKLYTYLKNKPIAQIVCDNHFANYIGYLFDNGMITADRMLRVNRLSEIKKDAIYVFDANNFEYKILLDKFRLRREGTRYILHNPGWEDEVGEVANLGTSDSLHEEAIKLVKRRTI